MKTTFSYSILYSLFSRSRLIGSSQRPHLRWAQVAALLVVVLLNVAYDYECPKGS